MGATYGTENFANYRALSNQTDIYCRSTGGLNPDSDQNNTLSGIWTGGYKTLKGKAAVKAYLTDTYDKSIDNTKDINGSAGRGGDWASCFGLPIAPVPTTTVTREVLSSSGLSGTFDENCTPYTRGNNVYELVEVGSSANNVWFSNPSYENNAPSTGKGVMWIWGAPNGNTPIGVPGSQDFTFITNFCSSYEPTATPLTIIGGVDDYGILSVNGNQIWPTLPKIEEVFTFKITGDKTQLKEGVNQISLYCRNGGDTIMNPAGCWLAITLPNGAVIAATNSIDWRCHPGRQSIAW